MFALITFLCEQIRPLIAPTKQILEATDVRYKWHEFFPDGKFSTSLILVQFHDLISLPNVLQWIPTVPHSDYASRVLHVNLSVYPFELDSTASNPCL